ncbi:MAG: threonine dehydrogenase-like Zn-dependent dehydrogenase [Halieaceae bacterium]|jgi:threonine dehydrogenase-like Zn-dependent dehydrogenase
MSDPTMQQLTFVEPHKFEWREVVAPLIESGIQATVRPLAVTRCDLDLYIANGLFKMKSGGFAFGHEIAGEIVEIGSDVCNFLPGDKVVVPFQISCGSCDNCRRGYSNACESVPRYSAYGLAPSSGKDWGGGLSDLVLVPYADAMLVKIPEAISLPAAAAISDNASDGFRAVAEPLKRRPGSEVLIVGGLAQSVGFFAIQAARAMGSARVVYTDFDPARLAHARTLGAQVIETHYRPTMPAADQFPIVVDASNIPEGLIFALNSTAACGTCTGISAGAPVMDGLPLAQMYMKGISFEVSRVHARATIEAVMDCASCGSIKHEEVITTTLPFSQAGEVMTDPDVKIAFVRDDA